MTKEEAVEVRIKLFLLMPSAKAEDWLKTPHPRLDYKAPMEARYAQVKQIVERLERGQL